MFGWNDILKKKTTFLATNSEKQYFAQRCKLQIKRCMGLKTKDVLSELEKMRDEKLKDVMRQKRKM